MTLQLEYCVKCGETTGRAGRADDSLFVTIGGEEIGPLCLPCYRDVFCETCQGTGEIDETRGGIGTSGAHNPCPDCTPAEKFGPTCKADLYEDPRL